MTGFLKRVVKLLTGWTPGADTDFRNRMASLHKAQSELEAQEENSCFDNHRVQMRLKIEQDKNELATKRHTAKVGSRVRCLLPEPMRKNP